RFQYSLNLNASFCQPSLALDRAEIKASLFMRQGSFASARLPGVRVGGQFDMEGARFSSELAMDGAEIKGDLFMRQGSFESARLHGVQVGGQLDMEGAQFSGEVNLQGATVDGELIMKQATFKKELAMDGAEVKGDIFMGQGSFASARLPGVQVGGQLAMEGAKFSGKLAMDRAGIKGGLFMGQGSFTAARLPGVQVGGQLSMTGAGFRGMLDCEGMQVASHLLMAGARFFKEVNLSFCRVGGGLSLDGAHLSRVDLSQSSITGVLRLSSPDQGKAISWCKGSLDLRHTTVGAVLDGQEDWPASLRLDGFRYASIGSLETEKKSGDLSPSTINFTTASDRPASWYVGWLEKQKDFSMDPYRQCARFLRESGQPDKANEVMYAGLERERKQLAKRSLPRLGRTLLKGTIGYGLGYRYFRALIWALLFLIAGAVVCGAGGGSSHGALFCLGFSLDNMLPLIDLRPEHEAMSMALAGFAKFYFLFIQQLVGWVLVLCVAAGLAGVGKLGGRD
ncbi:MAG: hypothetical protein KJ720_18255, partial [Proteobacteria bacterium]|nr:hypothetical protein [Pseudomonadota bacterium]